MTRKEQRKSNVRRRFLTPERLEQRQLLAADPIHVGVVYLETDYLESDQDVGGDSRGDRFILSFNGGAPDTELTELRIITDKDGDGISVGDPIYDTAPGGRGTDGSAGFQIVRVMSADGRAVDAVAEVEDGGQELVLRLSNFRAGDRLEFTLDVDEVLRNALDLAIFNDRLDVITSGQEFQDSILNATFEAPHYEATTADTIFENDYGSPNQTLGLNIPPDEGPDVDSRPDRSAAAIGTTTQVPKPISISGHVWLDNNLDLVRDSGEQILANIEIELWQLDDSTGSYVDTGLRALTDENGRYEFSKSLALTPGSYQVVQSQPSGFFSVGSVPGTVDGLTVGSSETPNILTNIVIPLGDQSAIDYDFAESTPASISGYVYRDDSDDGIRDFNEIGIGGVTIRLVPVNTVAPQAELTVTTARDGSYSFTGLVPGEYEVIEVTQPANLSDGRDTAGTVDGVVVGVADNPGDRISRIVLNGNDEGIEYNFGEVALGSLSGFVYMAGPGQDCTGDHDAPGNTPLAGVRVELQTVDGITVSQITTTQDGSYSFDDLPHGNYRIVQFTPNGLLDGDSYAGRIAGVTVGDAVDGGLISSISLNPGGTGTEFNFCEASPATISGFVYEDDSNDGVRDSNEAGIEGVIITLVDSNGTIVAQTRTDANGRYQFDGIVPGDYSIIETQPDGYLDGIDSVGKIGDRFIGRLGDDGDSIRDITIKQGETGTEFNFGELRGASISGRVHIDTDGDCEIDPDEEFLEGVVIRLINQAGAEVARTTTNANGEYTFDGIVPGTYTVVEEQPVGFFEGGANPGSAGGNIENANRIGSIDLTAGEVAVDYNFCENPPAEIVGSVFSDLDGDCIFEPDEVGIDGVQVDLYDADGNLVASTTTDLAGNYRFSNLPAGNYTIRETQPAGFLHGGQTAGSHGGDDSVVDVISSIRVGWGERLTNYDFCEIEPSSISGFVYVDGNGDCERQDDEPPLAGVTIELRDASGTRVATTTTDANGQYTFDNLTPGEYTVFESQPEGYLHGGQRLGSGGGQVLGDDLLSLTLGAGSQLVDYNFCEVAPASISGLVAVDNDGDCEGVHDGPALEGVTIELRDVSGNRIATTTTDANGQYKFEGLAPGQYQVFEYQPDGYFHGGQSLGSGGGTVLGQDLLLFEVAGGQQLENYDFCEVEPAWLAGSVWQETDLNREFNPGDVPLPGVLVELIDDSGTVIDSRLTDSNGDYLFDSLTPGVYSIRETQPTHLLHGGQLVGTQGGRVGGDDLLVEIDLKGGQHGDDYDFPEVPPATISGYVFQDGEAIVLSERPPAEELRNFRDGAFTSDDDPINGVTLQLRNVLGQPVDASLALPGTYPAGAIEVTTDATGYYEFTGLRPGGYHVYEVQPDDYIDSLDTPGTKGGVPVNPADEVDNEDRIVIQTLTASEATNPRDDAILNVFVNAGDHSQSNNFSEIVIEDPGFVPPVKEQQERILVTAPVDTFDTQIRLATFANPEGPRSPLTAYDEWAVSWHLSVINGGFPRGAESLDGEGGISGVSAKRMRQNWTEGDHISGRWSLMTRDGERLEISDDMTLGEEGGTALSGDFDGDGTDEAAIYAAGQWFVDLNGNGVWDAGDLWIRLGTALDRPVVGDWDGDGKDDIGIFGREWQRDQQRIKRDPGLPDPDNKRRRTVDNRKLVRHGEDRGEDRERLLRLGNRGELRADAVDHVFKYGDQVDTPIAGDWNGDGIDQIAVFRGGVFLLDSDGDGRWTKRDEKANFGRLGDEPIVGDFNGDGIDEIGVIRGDVWIIDTDGDRKITGNDAQFKVPRENANSQPIVGDWDGDGNDDPGYYDDAA